MTVGGRDLFFWSFLMASAHGAGLMVVPVLLSGSASAMQHEHMSGNSSATASAALPTLVVIAAVVVHTAAMLVVAAGLALAFFFAYENSGLALLRRTWFNFDLLWALALLLAGCAVLVQ